MDFGLQALAAGRIGVPLGLGAGAGGACVCPNPATQHDARPATASLHRNAPIVFLLNFIQSSGPDKQPHKSTHQYAFTVRCEATERNSLVNAPTVPPVGS